MRRLSLEELSLEAESFDKSVTATPGIDHFCSASEWVLPAAEALMPGREPWIHSDAGCYWAFMRGRHPEGFHYLEPLEAMWALACPVLGGDSQRLTEGLEELCAAPKADWKIMALAGLPAGEPLFVAIVSALGNQVKLGLGQSAIRLMIDLEDGLDGFLERRSRSFRRSIRRGATQARAAGIVFEDAGRWASPGSLFDRIMAVESRAWKGIEGVGITQGSMHDFYEKMLPRLHQHKSHRILFARKHATDIAYILGGVRDGGYRGLQFSYDVDYAEFGLGNLLQIEQIRRLCEEGIGSYDLGMDMEYKRRWADYERESVTLLALRG